MNHKVPSMANGGTTFLVEVFDRCHQIPSTGHCGLLAHHHSYANLAPVVAEQQDLRRQLQAARNFRKRQTRLATSKPERITRAARF